MTPVPSSKPKLIGALTGIRALAAFWVVFLHFGGDFQILLPPLARLDWLTGNGRYGVDIFFILSGFILSYTYQDSIRTLDWKAYSTFVWHRFARIYPAYLMAVLLMALIVFVALWLKLPWNREAYRPGQLVLEIFMVQQWTFQGSAGWNYPDWSVSVEWFAYLFIFPLTYVLLKYIRRVFAVVVLILATLAIYTFLPEADHGNSSWGLFQVSFEFIAGALFYRLSTLVPPLKTGLGSMIALVAVFTVLGVLWTGPDSWAKRILLLAGIGSLVFTLRHPKGILPVILGSPVMVYLGEISYSVYLIHGIDQRILKVICPTVHFTHASLFQRTLIFVFFLGTIIAGACLLYHLVEVPARKYLRKMYDHKPGESGVVSKL